MSGCEKPANKLAHGLPLPEQTYEHVGRLSLDVREVQIFQGDVGAEAGGDFAVSLADRALLYLSKKFKASDGGHEGRLVVIIEDASVDQVHRGSRYSFLDRVGLDGVDQYSLKLTVRLEHHGDDGRVLYGRRLQARKMLEVSEHESLAQREQEQFNAVEELFAILDPEMLRVIRAEMNL